MTVGTIRTMWIRKKRGNKLIDRWLNNEYTNG